MRKSQPPFLIGLNGKIGSGKTSLGVFIQEELEKRKVHFKFVNFADKLKQICKSLTGHGGYTQEEKNIYLEEWGMTVGEALQKIGTNAMRDNFHSEVWVIATLSNLKRNTVYIIGDARFPNEAEKIKSKNGIVIRINGDPVEVRKNSKRDINHSSETALDNYDGFNEIYNNDKSIDDLKKFAVEILDKYLPSYF